MGYSSGPSDRGPGNSSSKSGNSNQGTRGSGSKYSSTYGRGPVNRSPHKNHNNQRNNKDNYKRSGGDSKPKTSGNPYNKPAPDKYKSPLHDWNNSIFNFLNKFPAKPGTPDGRTDEGDIAKSVVNGNVSYRWRQEGMNYNMNQNINPVAYGNNTGLAREYNSRARRGGRGGSETSGPINSKLGKIGGRLVDGVFGIAGKVIGTAAAGPIGGFIGGKVASNLSKKAREAGSGTPMRPSGPGAAGEHSAYKKQNFAQTNRMMDYDDDILGIDGPIKPKKDTKPKNNQRYGPTKIF